MKERKKRLNKTPAYAVLITLLNLDKKWAPGVVCFRLSATRLAGKADMLTTNKNRPQVQSVGSKTNVNHAHRRGTKLFN